MMNCRAINTYNIPHQTRHHISHLGPAADQNSDFLHVSTFLPVHIQQIRDQQCENKIPDDFVEKYERGSAQMSAAIFVYNCS